MANERTTGKPLAPFTGMDSSRNYRAMYRAACNFHEKHNPTQWNGLVFGATPENEPDCSYWGAVVDEMQQIATQFDNDPFITAMLLAIFDELEREYHLIADHRHNLGGDQSYQPPEDLLQKAINDYFPA